ncbi:MULTISPECIES: hypothetical protein [unclassified Agarivorans]|uniref:hypothetical protein n=1 Tax=unclassified Agarivorans TaxID=2636026 RepID=UPI0026E3967D|nr:MULTISPECIES: hypothetical protein [unclassified Agarivorans]MDO6686413.1 hypothetical protein [Agarivorans sp. 3_MG-2023]MDO6713715.1 hypothetical protein [Agarivorans sp. 2_MG-2023]
MLINLSACASTLTSVKLKVVDQDGLPVENAEVFLGFILGNEGANVKELTDKNGQLKATRRQNLGVIVRVNKEGYYQSKLRTGPSDQNLTVELRKKKNPTAMYAKTHILRFPKKQAKIGFDFEQADWVAPYGKGNTAHIYFNLDGEYVDMWNHHSALNITFPNSLDGIIEVSKNTSTSEFKFPYLAYSQSYKNSLVLKKSREGLDSKRLLNYDESALGYIFRVNTEINSEGEIINANYGKVLGYINTSSQVKKKSAGAIRFTYYYNPTPNDRSLEFDWRQNLFRDLEHEEKVKAP